MGPSLASSGAAAGAHMGFVPGACAGVSRRPAAVTPVRTERRRRCRRRVAPDPDEDYDGPVLELRDVWLREPGTRWGYYLFEALDFEMHPNELVLVVGENGVGKTTLMDMLAGHIRPSHGRALWKGNRAWPRVLTKQVGSVFQFPGDYFLGRTVLEELVYGRNYARPDDVRSVLAEVGLYNLSLVADPQKLSGGQKRRLALASQMMRQPLPEVLLLDEPLAGVDRRGHRGIVEIIEGLKKRCSVVAVTHDPGLLLSCADRMVQLAERRLWPVPEEVLRRGLEIRRQRDNREW